MELGFPRLGFAQARRILLLQGRLRSNEPTQILACAIFGAVIGALVTGLHWGVDWAHGVIFNIAGNHTLSTGIGIDVQRILIVPVLGTAAMVHVAQTLRPPFRSPAVRG